jgi:pyruvate-ferredoxin/flavodoxin oxidoreductase
MATIKPEGEKIKEAIKKSYSRKGDDIVRKNFQVVDQTLAHLNEMPIPQEVTATERRSSPVSKPLSSPRPCEELFAKAPSCHASDDEQPLLKHKRS